jgi:hypothetical protein
MCCAGEGSVAITPSYPLVPVEDDRDIQRLKLLKRILKGHLSVLGAGDKAKLPTIFNKGFQGEIIADLLLDRHIACDSFNFDANSGTYRITGSGEHLIEELEEQINAEAANAILRQQQADELARKYAAKQAAELAQAQEDAQYLDQALF